MKTKKFVLAALIALFAPATAVADTVAQVRVVRDHTIPRDVARRIVRKATGIVYRDTGIRVRVTSAKRMKLSVPIGTFPSGALLYYRALLPGPGRTVVLVRHPTRLAGAGEICGKIAVASIAPWAFNVAPYPSVYVRLSALLLAHEVGHLLGARHSTPSDGSIMDADDGGDHFSATSAAEMWECVENSPNGAF